MDKAKAATKHLFHKASALSDLEFAGFLLLQPIKEPLETDRINLIRTFLFTTAVWRARSRIISAIDSPKGLQADKYRYITDTFLMYLWDHNGLKGHPDNDLALTPSPTEPKEPRPICKEQGCTPEKKCEGCRWAQPRYHLSQGPEIQENVEEKQVATKSNG